MIIVTNMELYNSDFKKTEHNFQITKPTRGLWESPEIFEKVREMLERIKFSHSKVNLEEVNKRGLEAKVG